VLLSWSHLVEIAHARFPPPYVQAQYWQSAAHKQLTEVKW
jgi:hypothetical protein